MELEIKTKLVPKGEILLHRGEYCHAAYRVQKGCLRSYIIDKQGKEIVFQFAPEDWVIADMDSILNQKPAVLFIDAIEDSEVQVFHRANIELYFNPMDKINSVKLVNHLIASHKRLISFLSHSAEERYLEFLETYPGLMQRLPLKYIASYLGMTPEYLSDVRRRLSKK